MTLTYANISSSVNLDYKISQLEEILIQLPLLTDEETEGMRGYDSLKVTQWVRTKAGLSSCPPVWFYYALCLLTYYLLGSKKIINHHENIIKTRKNTVENNNFKNCSHFFNCI